MKLSINNKTIKLTEKTPFKSVKLNKWYSLEFRMMSERSQWYQVVLFEISNRQKHYCVHFILNPFTVKDICQDIEACLAHETAKRINGFPRGVYLNQDETI